MTHTFALRNCDLNKLNSMTKYPSIPTYHALGERGSLRDEVVSFRGEVILTEKIDGTNARIICLPDGNFLLGSREELLYAKGDLIGNPAMGIVNSLRDIAEKLTPPKRDTTTVFYGEFYGGKVTSASKQYTSEQRLAWRLFDIAEIPTMQELFEANPSEISSWRENGGQAFFDETRLTATAASQNLELTPRLGRLAALPVEIEATHDWLLQTLPTTLVALDAGAHKRPEGVVARTAGRETIAKLRFEDYARHLKRQR